MTDFNTDLLILAFAISYQLWRIFGGLTHDDRQEKKPQTKSN